MPGFRFRLKTSLRLAEQKLDERKIQLAKEVANQQELIVIRDQQKNYWNAALEGQRKAGINCPEDLGIWQVFTSKQLGLLRQREHELVLQEELVAKSRLELIEAKRECEKLIRLREKQATAFQLELNHREQVVLDEVGQVQYRNKFIMHNAMHNS
ncbi:MAG: flagellar export protein FliJ [Desulfitobacteriaceae bacterium]